MNRVGQLVKWGLVVVEKIEPNLIIDGTVGRKAILHIQRSQ